MNSKNTQLVLLIFAFSLMGIAQNYKVKDYGAVNGTVLLGSPNYDDSFYKS